MKSFLKLLQIEIIMKMPQSVYGSYLHVIIEASIRLYKRSTSELWWTESCWTANTSIIFELCLTVAAAASTLIFCARENSFLISCNVTGISLHLISCITWIFALISWWTWSINWKKWKLQKKCHKIEIFKSQYFV